MTSVAGRLTIGGIMLFKIQKIFRENQESYRKLRFLWTGEKAAGLGTKWTNAKTGGQSRWTIVAEFGNKIK